MRRVETGRIGEETCVWYLEKHGYTVLDRNVHARYGEIDVIAENEDFRPRKPSIIKSSKKSCSPHSGICRRTRQISSRASTCSKC